MKKTIYAFATLLMLTVMSVSVKAQSSSDEALIGKARGAAHDCLQPFLSNGTQIDASVETTSICFVSGELHKVVFYTTTNCHPTPCPAILSVLVATVYFDCDNNVTSVECTGNQ